MEIVQTEQGPLNIVLFEGQLFRADKMMYEKPNPNTEAAKREAAQSPRQGRIRVPRFNTTATNAYTETAIKYFTVSREEALSYAKRGAPYMYTWTTREPLRLLNMYDYATHETVLETVTGNACNAVRVAFPTNATRKVYRHSTPETQSKNDMALKSMCEIVGVDGYFIPRQEGGPYAFHSEIGLCKKAFSKLKLVEIENTGLSAVNRVGQSWIVGAAPAAPAAPKPLVENMIGNPQRRLFNNASVHATRRLFGNNKSPAIPQRQLFGSPLIPKQHLFNNASPANPQRRLFENNGSPGLAGRKRSRSNLKANNSNNGLASPPPIHRRRTLRK